MDEFHSQSSGASSGRFPRVMQNARHPNRLAAQVQGERPSSFLGRCPKPAAAGSFDDEPIAGLHVDAEFAAQVD